MASQNSLNVFSKTGLKWFSPNIGQVGLCGDWKVHSHTGVLSQIGTAQLLGRGEGPGWEMESERARAWVGPGHTQLYCLEDVRKGGLADGPRSPRGLDPPWFATY